MSEPEARRRLGRGGGGEGRATREGGAVRGEGEAGGAEGEREA